MSYSNNDIRINDYSVDEMEGEESESDVSGIENMGQSQMSKMSNMTGKMYRS